MLHRYRPKFSEINYGRLLNGAITSNTTSNEYPTTQQLITGMDSATNSALSNNGKKGK